ncbi:Gfo/Idh/MocA family protein [Ruminiclostridium cellulolyticum]|uniref:Oxidoreductase domain protein n=1 Tax=Ruminiclostridium cellulolyticum (strain ATCC 35319 / DSM 5812 / JCM 6584 / H10) TaxID=394503 RepID=B8HZY3_RUMCH|nr:Gfo/Idh/MocA family oxidoreductase [Ruminiclostridium cellulolyticum]ACL75483.1 oxidoreductase domain protein [Ruminiclostridium cellulolyticum H10]
MSVRYGIIGLGGIAQVFAGALKAVQNAELTAVASSSRERAESFSRKFNTAKIYDSYTELILDKDVDVVYVALTHNFHYDIVKKCIENGKAVLCEKPLTTNRKNAEELIALSRKKKVLLMEAMWTRCLPSFQKAKKWVDEGRIGDVRLIDAKFCFNAPYDPKHRLFNPELAGGSLYDTGVYVIEFTTGILGEKPEKVSGFATIADTGVDDFAVINMTFKRGTLAMLSCGTRANVNKDARIYGTNGNIVVYEFFSSRKCELYDNDNNLVESFEDNCRDGFIHQIRHFSNLFESGKLESDIIPLEDTAACAEVFDELLKQWRIV